jgi:hypothetical protein
VPEVEPNGDHEDYRQMTVEVHSIESVHQPPVRQHPLLQVHLPEDAEGLLQIDELIRVVEGKRHPFVG